MLLTDKKTHSSFPSHHVHLLFSPCRTMQLYFFKTRRKTCRTNVFNIYRANKGLKFARKTHSYNTEATLILQNRAKLLWLQLRATISGSKRFLLSRFSLHHSIYASNGPITFFFLQAYATTHDRPRCSLAALVCPSYHCCCRSSL